MSEHAVPHAPAHEHHVNPWLVLVLVCMAQFMVILDATIVNVALPSIQEDLEMSDADLQWIVNAYTLIFGGFLLLGGRAGDLVGRKKVFLVGVVIFTVASLLNGLAPTSELLILFRGAARARSGADRARRAVDHHDDVRGGRRAHEGDGRVGGDRGRRSGRRAGPRRRPHDGTVVAVDLLREHPGRRSRCCWRRCAIVPESKDEHAHKSFDLAGAVTVTAGLLTLVYGIVKAQEKGWTSLHTGGFFVLAFVLLAAFVVIERRSVEPLVRLGIFRVRTVRAANVVMFLVAAGLFAMFYFNTLYLQRVLGYSALEAGLAFLPFTAGVIVGAGLSQSLVPKLGAREVPLIGMPMAIAGMLLFMRLQPDSSYVTDLLPGILLASVGMGLTFVPITLIATSGIPHDDAGLASGLYNTSQQIGGALGLAILATLAVEATEETLVGLGREPRPADEAQALVDGFHVAYAGSAIMIAVAAVLMFFLLSPKDVVAVGEGEPALGAAS